MKRRRRRGHHRRKRRPVVVSPQKCQRADCFHTGVTSAVVYVFRPAADGAPERVTIVHRMCQMHASVPLRDRTSDAADGGANLADVEVSARVGRVTMPARHITRIAHA